MFSAVAAILAASAATVSAVAVPRGGGGSGSASVTPHEQYSSSIGVLGCLINTNRVAYWPMGVDCNNICVKVTNGDRSLNLLKIDQSGGAYDISYDAWNYLGFGEGAEQDPHTGGGIPMTYEFVDASECSDLLHDGKLPLSASNSMNYVASCMSEPNSWVNKNHELINMADPLCKYGYDEVCTLDLNVSNQPSCPHTLGAQVAYSGKGVTNIAYGTGKTEAAQ
ncbi:hypothetical protein BBK36DRAFT_1156688 [Trichoderma citrinoviride]|uniref:Cerato-platanin n=1 Tax=Trichoderma citrinoviride TaxID=58853 RepID=A0A2T4BGH0_9HYPO|nr:hypothetical protein BBK36DRAFT_1156688 [Trichoderma citrinoviride]PTB68426.1 hypothetical protein BBK36DRAFT_1156688 [Trichoderma citrinoviride]